MAKLAASLGQFCIQVVRLPGKIGRRQAQARTPNKASACPMKFTGAVS